MLCPARNLLLVQLVAPPTHTPGGILIPEAAQTFQNRAKVISHSCPGGIPLYPVGTIVWFIPYAGTDVTTTDASGKVSHFLLLRPDDIVASEVPDDSPSAQTALSGGDSAP